MIRNTADFIVSVLVISIAGAIIFTLFLLFKGEVMYQFFNGLKNNTGNYSTYKILMWVAIFVTAYFFISWIFTPKPTYVRDRN